MVETTPPLPRTNRHRPQMDLNKKKQNPKVEFFPIKTTKRLMYLEQINKPKVGFLFGSSCGGELIELVSDGECPGGADSKLWGQTAEPPPPP